MICYKQIVFYTALNPIATPPSEKPKKSGKHNVQKHGPRAAFHVSHNEHFPYNTTMMGLWFSGQVHFDGVLEDSASWLFEDASITFRNNGSTFSISW